jgi:hypothetical protein
MGPVLPGKHDKPGNRVRSFFFSQGEIWHRIHLIILDVKSYSIRENGYYKFERLRLDEQPHPSVRSSLDPTHCLVFPISSTVSFFYYESDLRANPLLSAPFATQICGLQKLRNIFLSNTNLNGSLDACIQIMQLDRLYA